MERLAEQIVAWHNRHPFARRIALRDVHTVGVVALPFVRASAQAGGLVEPVLTDAVTFDELAAAPRASRMAALTQRLRGIGQALIPAGRTQWRAFNEKFLPGLSPARVEQFALAHGFTEPPAAPESRPWRVIVIDETLASKHSGWPFELYLMTAGIDAGSKRTRILAGRGIPSEIVGRRLWDPRRLGAAAAGLVLLAALGAWLLWPRHPAEPVPVADAAPAASAPMAAASMPASAAAAISASAASAAASDAQPAQTEAGSAPASAPASALAPQAAASEPAEDAPPPDIRPRLVERADGIKRPPLRSTQPAELPAGKAGEKAAEKTGDKLAERAGAKPGEKAGEKAVDKAGKSAEKTGETAPGKGADAGAEPANPRTANLAGLAKAPDKTIVALVGPPGSKADAEAMLKKIQAGLVGVHGNPQALQADVIQTPEGWRAAVWPFPSREQAQLINATLIARGLKTKAVNF